MGTSLEKTLGFEMAPEEGFRVSAVVGEEHLNTAGYLHGAFPFALADTAMGGLLWRHIKDDGKRCMTLEMSSRFVKSAKPGERLTAVPEIVHHGRSTAVLQADVRNEAGELVFQASATFMIRERPPPT